MKTLNSSGQVLNDQGNVINDTSDFWTEKYNQAEPKPDKILHSDGTIKDSAGNLIQDTTEYNVQKYNQAEPIPAKYLHADGTIDENPGSGGGADLEDNKEVTIDVSTYTEPVEITPTAGKDGMKKATVTLSNIPSLPTYPEWLEKGNELNSIVPNNIQCAIMSNNNGQVFKEIGNGTDTLGTLAKSAGNTFNQLLYRVNDNIACIVEVVL